VSERHRVRLTKQLTAKRAALMGRQTELNALRAEAGAVPSSGLRRAA
jgi:hypothetical protein